MTLSSGAVAMPKKKITFKFGTNGTTYVYYTLRAYRNSKGKPTSEVVAIGKKEAGTGMLIPNKKYFELFPSDEQGVSSTVGKPKSRKTALNRVASHGTAFALMEAAKSTGLRETLESCFPERWSQILSTAFYMVCEGNVMMYVEDWFDETEVPFAEPIDDQQCSRLFASISFDDRIRFFREWVKRRPESEYLAYDVTSVSTWSKGLDDAEWGYNRDSESMPQLNIGMFYGADSRLPVYYDVYGGSVTDKSRLAFMIESAGKLGICKARLVLDRGFFTANNLKFLAKKAYLFVTAFPGHMLEAQKLIDGQRNHIRKAINRLEEHGLYAVAVDTSLYGLELKAHIFFSLEKQFLDEKLFFAHMEGLETELSKMGKGVGATRKYRDFFKIDERKGAILGFEPDCVKIDERLGRMGFFVLLSNDADLDSGRVLGIYRGRDVIEKNFDHLKNGLDFRRLRTHVNETTDGKLFTGFIALILRSYLLNKIKAKVETREFTLEKALKEYRKIRVVTFDDGSRMLTPLTKTQRHLLEAIGVSPVMLVESFSTRTLADQ
jgi:hypothetical protein